MNSSERFEKMEAYIANLQTEICNGLEEQDGGNTFVTDEWVRPEGGGGKTRVIQDGAVFEKGGVNISSVSGKMPAEMAERLKTVPQDFRACGLSLVIHPSSPKVPTIHMNVRYFEMEDGNHWYGGGIDLTPYYPYLEDFTHFHSVMKNACESNLPNSYERMKKECDEYFRIQHRQEMRGIGGVFFDYLKENSDLNFGLVKSIGNSFLSSYVPIVAKRKNENYTDDDKQFQLVRRGRYVEFNLIYDRGTLFGLKTNGRVESILMSLPKEVNFLYNWQAKPNSPHFQMLEFYQPKKYI